MLKFLFRLFIRFVLRLAPREAVVLSGSRHRGAELSFYLPDGRSLDTNGCFGGIQNPIFSCGKRFQSQNQETAIFAILAILTTRLLRTVKLVC